MFFNITKNAKDVALWNTLEVVLLGKVNKKKTAKCNNDLTKFNNTIIFDKKTLKEAIIEAYKEIDKENNKRHIPTEALKIPMDMILNILAALVGFFALVLFVCAFYFPITDGVNTKNIFVSIIIFVISLICAVFCYTLWKTRIELSKETNKNYILAYFSAITSFVALIISLVSILK